MIDVYHDTVTCFEGSFKKPILTSRFDDELNLTEDTLHRGTGNWNKGNDYICDGAWATIIPCFACCLMEVEDIFLEVQRYLHAEVYDIIHWYK